MGNVIIRHEHDGQYLAILETTVGEFEGRGESISEALAILADVLHDEGQ